jgi:hypothetical protein
VVGLTILTLLSKNQYSISQPNSMKQSPKEILSKNLGKLPLIINLMIEVLHLGELHFLMTTTYLYGEIKMEISLLAQIEINYFDPRKALIALLKCLCFMIQMDNYSKFLYQKNQAQSGKNITHQRISWLHQINTIYPEKILQTRTLYKTQGKD